MEKPVEISVSKNRSFDGVGILIQEVKNRIVNLFGIRVVSFKRCLKEDGLTLRLRRFSDLPVLYSLLTPELLLQAGRIGHRAMGSLFSFWIWLKMTFHMIYIIEVEEMGNRRIIGFAGLYDMKLGESLGLSLVVFDAKDRREGHGKQTAGLLFECLREKRAVKTVFVEISRKNVVSLRFFRKLGFELCSPFTHSVFPQGRRGNSVLTLKKSLS
jgi:RimJ/RimL family protein N-acetyltransferase